MRRTAKNATLEVRIHNEIIVDANGPEERAVGWYSYLDAKTRFSFQARCIARRIVSPLREEETVQVHRMAPEDACSAEMLVLIRWHGRVMAVPLSQLAPVGVDEEIAEAIADWHYWVARDYLFCKHPVNPSGG
jgi:Calcium binding